MKPCPPSDPPGLTPTKPVAVKRFLCLKRDLFGHCAHTSGYTADRMRHFWLGGWLGGAYRLKLLDWEEIRWKIFVCARACFGSFCRCLCSVVGIGGRYLFFLSSLSKKPTNTNQRKHFEDCCTYCNDVSPQARKSRHPKAFYLGECRTNWGAQDFGWGNVRLSRERLWFGRSAMIKIAG